MLHSQEYECLYVVLLMASYWVTEALPLPVTSVIPIVLFPCLSILVISLIYFQIAVFKTLFKRIMKSNSQRIEYAWCTWKKQFWCFWPVWWLLWPLSTATYIQELHSKRCPLLAAVSASKCYKIYILIYNGTGFYCVSRSVRKFTVTNVGNAPDRQCKYPTKISDFLIGGIYNKLFIINFSSLLFLT